jgi:mono/diheme cytochrome c family protein
MWKCKGQEAGGRRQTAGGARSVPPRNLVSRFSCLLLTASCLLLSTACRRDMQDQPKAKPYRSSSFFKDGLSSRAPVEGTVPRGWLREDSEFFTGKKKKGEGVTGRQGDGVATAQTGPVPTAPTTNASAAQVAAAYPDDIDKFPLTITPEILNRGEQRYQIFCSACHGQTGEADGMIVRRGFRKPPSFHDPNLLAAPVGHYFDVVTNGWGAMPNYAAQIPVQDRWAIIAYIRALQLTHIDARATQTSDQTPRAGATPAPPAKNAGGQK